LVIPIRVPILDAAGDTRMVMTAGYKIEGGTTSWANMDMPRDISVMLLRDDGYRGYVHPLPDGDQERVFDAVYGRPVPESVTAAMRGLRTASGITQLAIRRVVAVTMWPTNTWMPTDSGP